MKTGPEINRMLTGPNVAPLCPKCETHHAVDVPCPQSVSKQPVIETSPRTDTPKVTK